MAVQTGPKSTGKATGHGPANVAGDASRKRPSNQVSQGSGWDANVKGKIMGTKYRP